MTALLYPWLNLNLTLEALKIAVAANVSAGVGEVMPAVVAVPPSVPAAAAEGLLFLADTPGVFYQKSFTTEVRVGLIVVTCFEQIKRRVAKNTPYKN